MSLSICDSGDGEVVLAPMAFASREEAVRDHQLPFSRLLSEMQLTLRSAWGR